MANASKAAIGLGMLALAAGVALWLQFGSLVYFDMLAAAFAGCFL